MDVLSSLVPLIVDAPPQTIGIVLAIAGNLIISFSLALTKMAHNLNQMRKQPLPYTRLPLWWCGLAATVIGECGNFAAYGFAGASLIAPLGAVSVLANAFIAAVLLGEGLRLRDLSGCLLCIGGGSIIVLATPEHGEELDPHGFIHALQATPFVVYIVVLIATVLVLLALQDTYGHRHVAYFVLLCSLLGSVTVLSCKGVATFLNLWLCCGAPSPFGEHVLYLLLLVLTSTAVLQIRYLNMAMERFGNTETVRARAQRGHAPTARSNAHPRRCPSTRSPRPVSSCSSPRHSIRTSGGTCQVPVYYVLFTLSTIVGSNILYRDFEDEDRATVALFGTGCILTFGGVWLLTSRRQRSSSIPPTDARREPMLSGSSQRSSGAMEHGMAPSAERADAPSSEVSVPIEPPLDRLIVPAHHSYFFPAAALSLDDELYEQGVPLGLLNSPLALSGDVLRRTFNQRLHTYSERASAQSDDGLDGDAREGAAGERGGGRRGHHRTNSSP